MARRSDLHSNDAVHPCNALRSAPSLQDTVEVLADAMRGGFGPWPPDASFVALKDGEPVGAALTALATSRLLVVGK